MFYISLMFSRCVSINTMAFLAHITARLWPTNHHISSQVPICIKLTPEMHQLSFDCHLTATETFPFRFQKCLARSSFLAERFRQDVGCVVSFTSELFSTQLSSRPQHEYATHSFFFPRFNVCLLYTLGSRQLKEVNGSSQMRTGEIFWLSTCGVVH